MGWPSPPSSAQGRHRATVLPNPRSARRDLSVDTWLVSLGATEKNWQNSPIPRLLWLQSRQGSSEALSNICNVSLLPLNSQLSPKTLHTKYGGCLGDSNRYSKTSSLSANRNPSTFSKALMVMGQRDSCMTPIGERHTPKSGWLLNRKSLKFCFFAHLTYDLFGRHAGLFEPRDPKICREAK